MQQINQSKQRVTGKVIGVIKKMNKTYGGSILNLDQMMPKTKEKYDQFAQINKVDAQTMENHYRVYVPYNNQMPQVLVKSKAPAALANKRLIIRIKSWPRSSPFPFG